MSGRSITDELELTSIAHDARTVAVLGIKDGSDPDAPAYNIPRILQQGGATIIGINPMVKHALGSPTLASLAELPAGVDVLDVFRRAEAIPGIVDEILALPTERHTRLVWLQSGIRHDDAAERLRAAGIDVVQDRCLGVYRRRRRP
jgi:predicted CoA-binding protein